ncbi:hypothetical protein BABINDRAFT_160790 [Babjeviella inositovora NRRL Y-12698]|uniref:Potassium channel domain-containing protein n=1 Tax=Babjeviella inositovora NRRL Y-12698 TaxID=984486 RepID=A0A1E3QS23_9ASCO|nr:uncharacterized protein BABINDRAFT_160790 [Babjeviella inositovora NRRL Y-12698]ODQ80516.1 hypothetical protein BABINDRAFT_160790 [Babjeviella inositovora NRRL Y-12698]
MSAQPLDCEIMISSTPSENAEFQKALLELLAVQQFQDEDFKIPRKILNVNHMSLKDLTIKPGDPHFVIWFTIATYFPIIAACMGPLASMTSIAALVLNWRRSSVSNTDIKDYHWVTALNAVSLALGFIANFSLLLNFSQRFDYKRAQIVSISGWFIASIILMVILLLTHVTSFRENKYSPTDSFWYGVLTAIIYMTSSLVLSVNFIGYLLGKYSARFNLDSYQRSLMFQTLLLSTWLSIGSAFLSHLMSHSYGVTLYYCTVTILTIGLGDITPKTHASKGLTLVFALIGLLILGLIISTIRDIILSDHFPTMIWNHIERERRRAFADHEIECTEEEMFDMMNTIRVQKLRSQKYISLIVTLVTFICFWMLGAVVFHCTEGWPIFDCVYFCFLCLLTIGYGDFAPATVAGRPFFVVWALSAVPLMTMLISNMSDTLISSFGKYTERFQELIGWPLQLVGLVKLPSTQVGRLNPEMFQNKERVDEGIKVAYDQLATLLRNDTITSDNTDKSSMTNIKRVNTNVQKFIDDLGPDYGSEADDELDNTEDLLDLVKIIYHVRKLLITMSTDEAPRHYLYNQWHSLLLLNPRLRKDPGEDIDPNFWISKLSPLKYPINESEYFLYRYLEALQHKINLIVKKRLISYSRPGFIADNEWGNDEKASVITSNKKNN